MVSGDMEVPLVADEGQKSAQILELPEIRNINVERLVRSTFHYLAHKIKGKRRKAFRSLDSYLFVLFLSFVLFVKLEGEKNQSKTSILSFKHFSLSSKE